MNQRVKNLIALIPARSGSVRVPDKNIRYLGDHPLIAYTISAAIQSEVFDSVLVSTDSEEYAKIAQYYGANVPFLRPVDIAGPKSPDIEWIEYTLNKLKRRGDDYKYFSILRPTSPFRQVKTIQRAWKVYEEFGLADSLRAVEICSQHPGKMWVVRGEIMYPLMPVTPARPAVALQSVCCFTRSVCAECQSRDSQNFSCGKR